MNREEQEPLNEYVEKKSNESTELSDNKGSELLEDNTRVDNKMEIGDI